MQNFVCTDYSKHVHTHTHIHVRMCTYTHTHTLCKSNRKDLVPFLEAKRWVFRSHFKVSINVFNEKW